VQALRKGKQLPPVVSMRPRSILTSDH
jgi:hypothetical protein